MTDSQATADARGRSRLFAGDAGVGGDPAREDHPVRRSRRGRTAALVVLGLVVLAGLYVGALWATQDRVPRGTTVAGVAVGGMSAEQARATLDEQLAGAVGEPLPVVAGAAESTLDPAAAGMTLDTAATVERLTGFGLEPARLWRQLVGAGPADPVTDVDDAALEQAVEAVAGSLDVPPVDGTLLFEGADPVTTAAVEGVRVDREAAVAAVRDGWLTAARPLELPTEVVPPAIDDDEVGRALDELAEPLVAGPVTVEVSGTPVQLPPDVLAGAASFVPEGERIELRLDGELLVEAVRERTTDLLTSPSEGTFSFADGVPVVLPGEPGTTIDPETLATAVAEAAEGERRTSVELVELAPEESPEDLQALGIREVVASFSTPLTSEPRRTSNIATGAAAINGTLVRPGEEFSLGEALGPVDAARGYVDAGVILKGEHVEALGGGLSQLSTTTFNAAFFAGFDILEHQPHSEWFARYPEGREATIFLPDVDMRWKNNTPYGALVQAWVSGGRTNVAIWSTPYWQVETTTSGRSAVVQPTTVYSQTDTCVPQDPGNPGFRVTVTRTVSRDGEVEAEDSWTTTYRPQNRIVCGPPPTS